MNIDNLDIFAKDYNLSEEDLLNLAKFLANDGFQYENYTHVPVGIREFVESPEFLNAPNTVYEKLFPDLIAMNSGQYTEIVLTGGIGSGKTTLALYTQAYQLYLLSCLKNPHKEFGLDSASEIIIVFQSINARLAKAVDYNRFKKMLEKSPYFMTHFPFDRKIESKLVFRNRIEVHPVSGLETAAIGQNVIGGLLDEINFMAVIQHSKMAEGGGTYDQATALYESIARRRKSRFVRKGGRLPGLICLVSSKKVPGQFTDRKEEEAKTNPSIYIFDKRVWDVKPDGTYSGEMFRVFVGDSHRKPRILKDHEVLPPEDKHMIDEIPIEYRADFDGDLVKALRDIAGRSTLAIHPYLPDREKVIANFRRPGVQSIANLNRCEFQTQQLKLFPSRLKNLDCFRFAHIDLGLTGDSAALVMGHCSGFSSVDRGEFTERLPVIHIDLALEVPPPKGGEIEFASIRKVLYVARSLGVPLRWVTMDSFQSVDTLQILKQQGFTVGMQSMDTSIIPYDMLKQALYDGRIVCAPHAKLEGELLALERDFKKNKVDHTAHSTKDLSDALAGVVYGLSMRRETWAHYKVQLTQAVSLFQHAEAAQAKAAAKGME